MQVYRTVVDSGSFARAAQLLRISAASTSRNVSDLERHLGATLLRRSSRSLLLTEVGKDYYRHCCEILDKITEAEDLAARAKQVMPGRLRINMPNTFGLRYIAPLLPQFMEKYPGIEPDVWCSDRFVDFAEDDFDLAIRVTSALDAGLIAKKLAPVRCVVVAAPLYLDRNGTPDAPEDLRRHDCLTYAYAPQGDSWRFLKYGTEHVVPVKSVFRANNGDVIRLACLAGSGVAMLPTFLIADDLRSGALVELFADYRFAEYGAYAVYPVDGRESTRIRAFVDFLQQAFEETPPV